MKYLFQGDSITDAGRGNREDLRETGQGYVRLLEAELTYADAEAEVLNGGISGNRVTDLLARWKKDCLNVRPDVLTILIGVNDVWHELDFGNGVSDELYEEVYRLLLRQTVEQLPDCRIVLMGAYVTHGTATDGEWETFEREVGQKSRIAGKLAEEFGTAFVDLQREFDRAEKHFGAEHWTRDGVHPTAAGHRLIAEAWLETVRESVKESVKGNEAQRFS